ncbi:hypothetical protein AWZ03_014108 [Drosophila navojoa]|uniref:Doublecortin domain-containing protein n=1 Tax=Drosophila navojoa TaxID=7232 RepID=A0A484AUD1_DRONA|nr:hypothetical protein AWZ03_014108 [Drosophila navojoa]
MSNEENDYGDTVAGGGAGTGTASNVGHGDCDGDGGLAAVNGEPILGGQTMPQISSNLQLEGDVSPTFTQPTAQFDDNDNLLNNNNSRLGRNSDSNCNSPTKSPTSRRAGSSTSFQIHLQNAQYDEDDDLAVGDLQGNSSAAPTVGGGGAAVRAAATAGGSSQDYWSQRNGRASGPGGGIQGRALSPSYLDNMSENSEQPPVVPLVRSKSRPEISSAAASRYSNLSYWKARRVVFYRNGDPFFPGVELRYRPGRDVTSLDNLLDKISPKMDLPRGARYVFSMDGDRKYHLDELEDGAFYVVSSFKVFKILVPRRQPQDRALSKQPAEPGIPKLVTSYVVVDDAVIAIVNVASLTKTYEF